jgi:8-oxo-dGTP pyrophosphatase MutT (NUDIX family)
VPAYLGHRRHGVVQFGRIDDGVIQEIPELRGSAQAILLDTDGRLLLQLRDNVPHIRNPGKIGLFGGGREGNESFLDCIVREIYEEIGFYLPPARFELIYRWFDPGNVHAEIFLAREVPVEKLTVTEGSLKIVSLDELEQLRDALTPGTQRALKFFVDREASSRRDDQA